METTLILAVAAILVVVGIVGTVLPALPGVLLVFGGLWLAAFAQDYAHVGLVGLVIVGALAAFAFLIDFLASVMGAKRVGASPKALAGAALGGFVGIFLGLPGILLGPFIGAMLGELAARGGWKQAGKVGVGTTLGLLFAAVAKLVIAFLMVGVFGAFYLFNA